MNSVCMILLWVVSIERCKLFSIFIRNSFFFSFLKLYISPQSSEDWLWQANAAWHSSQSVWVYTVYISETLLQCNNRAQWIPYWSCCKKTNWKHLFIILLDHHGVFSGSSKLKKKIQSMALRRGNYWFACFPECLYVCIHQSRAFQ